MSQPNEPTPSPVTVAIIGAGNRGRGYASYALAYPNECNIVAVAEPRPKTREHFVEDHKLPKDRVFATYEELLATSQILLEQTGKRIAEAVVIAVQDQMHAQVTLECAKQGFHILCEKPMATTPEDCIRMTDAVTQAGIVFGMGHVLRYSPYNHALVDVIRSGLLGKLLNVVHIEPVGNWHFAHSFVRGNWSKESKSSFSLMTKSCHDIDIVCHYLFPATVRRVSSFGSLSHFKKSEKPAEAGDATRCLDCAYEKSCPYSAKKIYLDRIKDGYKGWPVKVLTDGPPDIESVTEALKTGPYGVCVYESDNDVADHQVVNLEFSNGATCSFTMVAFTTLICERQTRLHFTHGEIVGDSTTLTVTNFRYLEGHPQRVMKLQPDGEVSGHGGGDTGLMRDFIKAVREKDQTILGTDAQDVLRSHLTVFAAEKARKEGTVVDVGEFEKGVRIKMES